MQSPDRVPPSDELIACRPARPQEMQAAVQLILSTRRGPVDEAQAVDFLRFADQRGIDIYQAWVAVRNDRVLWAVLPILSPGRTMLMFSPALAPRPAQLPAVRMLVDAITEHFSRHDVDLSQALMDPHEPAAQEVYLVCGFQPLAELIYLQKHVRPPAMAPQLAAPFAWRTYDAVSHELFARALPATYHQSLDCPGLNGMRDIEDVIAGHKSTGEFFPELWYLLTENDEPRGVLLLNGAPQSETIELVYLGLTPEARGRGLGDALMQQAAAQVLRLNRSRLALAVDSNNAPALKLYYRHGMQRISSRIALLKDLRQHAKGSHTETAKNPA